MRLFVVILLFSCFSECLTAKDTSLADAKKDSLLRMAEYYETEAFLFSKAIECRKQLIELSEETYDYEHEIESYAALGRIEIEIARYDLSYQYTRKALDLSKKYHDEKSLAVIYNNLGKVSYYCSDNEKAAIYYKQILQLPESDLNNYHKALAMNNSTVFEKDMDTIRDMMDSAMLLVPGDKYIDIRSTFQLNLSVMYINHGKYTDARRLLESMAEDERTIENEIAYLRNFGILHFEEKNFGKAKEYLEEAYRYCEMGEFELKRANVLSILNLVYVSLGEYENAYRALATYMEIENNIPKNKILLQLFNNQNEHALSEVRNRQRVTVIVGVFSFLIICLVLYLVYSRKIQKLHIHATEERLKYEIKEQNIKRQNDILGMKRLQQYQQEVLIDEIIRKLKGLDGKTGNKKLNTLIFNITRELEVSKDNGNWHEVEAFLLESNSEFFENLLKDFPDLTVNERRLCAFLHMNMTSKEISMITRKSVNSITTARSRLRAKLNIKGDDQSLVAFLDKYAFK